MKTWVGSNEHALVALLGARLGRPPQLVSVHDWQAVLALTRHSRTAALVQQAVAQRADVPEPVQRELLHAAQKSFVETTAAAQALGEIASALAGLRWSLLRGPALGICLYGDLALRPYGDLDVLVAAEDVDRALSALRGAGYSLPPNALAEAYYRRYHLHLELVRPGPPVTSRLELHWALDHPFTLLTVNAAELVERSQSLSVGQAWVPVPEVNDLLLALAIHLVKHMVQLPGQLRRQELAGIVRSGFLLQLFDIALLLQVKRDALDWAAIGQRATSWRAGSSARLSLEGVEALWPALTTDAQRQLFAMQPAAPAAQTLLQFVERLSPGAFGLKRGIFFRPVRLLDGLSYIVAPTDYLERRYGSAGLVTRLRHGLGAMLQLGLGGLRLGYYLLVKRLLPSRPGTGA